LTIELRAHGDWVRVQRLGGGKSKAVVYRVWIDDLDVGVFKLFGDAAAATNEVAMLKELAKLKLEHMKPVRERGDVSVDPQSGYQAAVLMDTAKGTTVSKQVETLSDDPTTRRKQIRDLETSVELVAQGLAEMHAECEDKSASAASKLAGKLSDAKYMLKKNFPNEDVKTALGADYQRVEAAMRGRALEEFLSAQVPATAYLGDANAGNFAVTDKTVEVFDVGTMAYSFDNETKKYNKPGAADVARFLGSLETLNAGKLRPEEVATLRSTFQKRYFAVLATRRKRAVDRNEYQKAERWYRMELEFVVLRTDPRAKGRILKLLEPFLENP
jgi:hypothetical protein